MSNCPARAGFTHRPSSRPTVHRDHPRSRGVYPFRPAAVQFSVGSSPLARGLPNQTGLALVGSGIIPARAGFTPHRRAPAQAAPDHPRSRGVYALPLRPPCVLLGSSPLARGLLSRILRGGRRWRIIPARAGFTDAGQGDGRAQSDHPRSRGVYAQLRKGAQASMGSSPLARGLPIPHNVRNHGLGIIPARAGFTWTCGGSERSTGDHPRSRGVYAKTSGGVTQAEGSSPLARGLRRARLRLDET